MNAPSNPMSATLAFVVVAVATTFASHSAAQIVVGQVDDFETIGSTEFWERGVNVDFQLQVTADGNGNMGKLVTFNVIQWSGDDLDAGVGAVRLDLENVGSQGPLSIRLALGDNINPGSLGSTWFSTNDAVELAPGESTTAVFALDEQSLVRVQGSASYDEVLGDVRALRILHNPDPAARGVNVIAILNVDNITALSGDPTAAPTLTPSVAPRLLPAYPNPFNPATTVSFSLPAVVPSVNVIISDLRGRHVRTLYSGALPAGMHSLVWNGLNARDQRVASGVYLVALRVGETVESRRLSLVK